MISNLTFSGGTHVKEYKEFSEHAAIEMQILPKFVHIPLLQGIGAECTPIVNVGDIVKVGQVIGTTEAKLGVNVHSSVYGKVTAISDRYTAEAIRAKCVTIEVIDGEEEFEDFVPSNIIEGISVEKIASIAKDAGIVGMGGAGFPFGAKVSGALSSEIDSVIANGAECEPFLTCDHRAMVEFPEDIMKGVSLVVEALNANAGYIAIEDNKPDAIKIMEDFSSNYENLTVASLKTKFPQGDSTRIIDAVLNRKVPAGARSGAVKAFVSNVGTFKACYDAISKGIPLYERVISVTGPGVKTPKNIMARVGTTAMDLIEQCGGLNGDVVAIVSGGPMSGHQIYDYDTPVTKTTTGLVVLTREVFDFGEEIPCIRCNRCIVVCPSKLNPKDINAAIRKDKFELARDMHAEECIQCGSCSYVCPSKRHIAESINLGLMEIKTKLK